MQFTKAVKTSCKARVALYGPSGSGKTYSALRIATGIGGKIGVIDSERGRASKYADRFDFAVLELTDKSIASYLEAILAAKAAGIEVLVIDSMTHGWQELLQEMDRLTNQKFKGNKWSAWSEGTPKQQRFIDAIIDYPGHLIATMRSKTEWEQQEIDGKKKPIRIGLAPQQGKDIEYEFDLLVSLSTDHVATVEKDSTGKFQDAIIDRPGEEVGKALAEWLSEGKKPDQPKPDAYATGNDFLARADTFEKCQKLSEWCLNQQASRKLSREQGTTLDAMIATKSVEACGTAAEFEACGTLLRALHGQNRLDPEKYGELCNRWADAKEGAVA